MAKKPVFTATAILCGFELEGARYSPGQLVEFDAATATDLADQGQVDKHKDAIAHLKEQGVSVIRHPAPVAEEEVEDTPPPPLPPLDPADPAANE